MPAASPASIEAWQVNRYYKSDEECLYAIAEAMREEYEAIVAAGFMLQIDDPRLVMHYMLHPEMSIEDARRWIARGSRRSIMPCGTFRRNASVTTPATASIWGRARTTSNSGTSSIWC